MAVRIWLKPPPLGQSHPYISRRDDRWSGKVSQGRPCGPPRRGDARASSLTDLSRPARYSLQEI
ncbi:hypothetical protein DBR21_12155 [Caulobacter sp. HMWF009]|nr:hypothetical protein DBR21_12155 [Caulobacter sp. HMWF009]PTT10294.1 hypothetical protein DBR10_05420 [Caulobacter sp. HMWF025]